MNPEVIYSKFCNGDDLTTDELEFGIGFFNKVSYDLSQCGDTFRLAANEAMRVTKGMVSVLTAKKSQ